jgi:glycosyltransferase involved in cell wall biosynthesis
MTRRLDVMLVGDTGSIHVRRLAAGLAGAGLHVAVAGFDCTDVPSDTRALRITGRGPGDVRFAAGIASLARLVRRHRPRVVNAHYLSSYGLMAALALALAFPRPPRPTLIQTVWGSDLLVTAKHSRLRRELARRALRAADLVTADSIELREAAAALAPGVPFHRFVFGPPAQLLDKPRSTERLVASTRRLDPDTRVGLVVRAFRRATAIADGDGGDWRLVVAGDGTAREDVRREAAGEPRIALVGTLAQAELHGLLGRASVFVSIPVSDGTSASLLEAMAMGVLPIVNDLPANREWVDADCGVIVQRDPDETTLANAMVEAMRRGTLPEVVRAHVAETTWEREISRLCAAIEGVAPRRLAR